MKARKSPPDYSGKSLPALSFLTYEHATEEVDAQQLQLIFGAINRAVSFGLRDGFEKIRRQQGAVR